MKTKRYASIAIVISFLFGLASFSSILALNNQSNPLTVQTEFGTIEGTQQDENTFAWIGIPYAKPPVGDLRWKAPQDPDPWSGIKKANKFSEPSVQIASTFGSDNLDDISNYRIIGSEDCLYMNIWKPLDVSGPLPVYFFIHGGAYIYGQGALDVYDGANLANKADCIVVNFNYRLGTAGFFKSSALQTGDALDDSGNFGILDQIKALEWTKNNIEMFGGDPNNIIIAGESAGGLSIFALLTSPYVKEHYFDKGIELFHAAVIESGIIVPTAPETAEGYANDLLVQILIKNGLAGDEEQALDLINNANNEVKEGWLRGETMEDLIFLSQGQSLSLFSLMSTVMGINDGTVVASNMYQSMLTGNFIRVPVIIGSNEEESKLFTAVAVDWTLQFEGDPSLSDLIQESTLLMLNEILALVIEGIVLDFEVPSIFGWLLELTYDYLADVITDILFTTLGVDLPAYLMSLYNRDIFAYQFCWNQEPAPLDGFLGACHSIELPFVFGNMDPDGILGGIWTDKNAKGRIALSDAMISYWKNFLKNGNPGDPDGGWWLWEGLPDWDDYLTLFGGTEKIIFDASNRKVDIYMD